MGRLKTHQERERLFAKKKEKREQDQIKEGDDILKGLQNKMVRSTKKHDRIVDFNGETVTVRRNIPQKIG